MNQALKAKLAGAKSLDQVKGILKDLPGMDPARVWQEMERHNAATSEKLDRSELDAVSGGAIAIGRKTVAPRH